jgi:carbon starvation protein
MSMILTQAFETADDRLHSLMKYWYHFAIMFEALFILTTIDTGTRIGRFLMQEMIARVSPSLGRPQSRPGSILATALIVGGWSYLILTGNISTIWPMFGIANQLLACTALCIATTILLREAKKKSYALVTILPLSFVGVTTLTAGVQSVFTIYLPMASQPATRSIGVVSLVVTSLLLVCVLLILAGSVARWLGLWQRHEDAPVPG